jgi:lysophospholipase L1-like esterase
VPPATTFRWRRELVPAPRIRELNAKIRAWARERALAFADFWTAMALPDGTMNPAFAEDTVHPNASGYATMEPIVRAAIAEALRAGRP